MPIVSEISAAVRGATAGLGLLVIPAIIAVVVLLALFAQNSYKLFRVGLPFLAALAGAYIGAGTLSSIIGSVIPAELANAPYIAGGVVALVLALLCSKFHKLTMTLVGLGLGALAVDGLVKSILWKFDFVHNIAESVPGGKAGLIVTIVGFVILAACAVLTAIILVKFFKGIYVLVTAIGGLVIAAAIPAIYIFANTNFADIAVVAFAAIGLIAGIFNVKKQMKTAI